MVGADGARSQVRKAAGLKWIGDTYEGLRVIVAHFSVKTWPQIVSKDKGSLYAYNKYLNFIFLPFSNDEIYAVIVLHEEEARKYETNKDKYGKMELR